MRSWRGRRGTHRNRRGSVEGDERTKGCCFVWPASGLLVCSNVDTSTRQSFGGSGMRLPTTRDVFILVGFLLVLVQFEIAFRPSSLSRSVYDLTVKLGLAHNPHNRTEYEDEHTRQNQTSSARVRWEIQGAPRTAIVAHAPGMSYISSCISHGFTLTHYLFQVGHFLTDCTSTEGLCILSQTTRRVYHTSIRSLPLHIQSSLDRKRSSIGFRPIETFKWYPQKKQIKGSRKQL